MNSETTNSKSLEKKNDRNRLFLSLKEKKIPTKYLYDELGSKLFEKICDTEEYYLTRIEKNILDENSFEIIKTVKMKEFFELGSGSSKKTKVLIKEALKINKHVKYISFDISRKALNMSLKELKNISKKLEINLIEGDFLKDMKAANKSSDTRMYLFLGSTIGNFQNKLAVKFLSKLSKVMRKDDYLLLGVDKVKDIEIIKSAYNDKKGITEKFNKNILSVINKKYSLNFNKNNFQHSAVFNEKKNQIEMYLMSKINQKIEFSNKDLVYFNKGDKILTEISRKFTDKALQSLFKQSLLRVNKKFNDKKNFFSLYLLESTK